jgi:hypothetical protein
MLADGFCYFTRIFFEGVIYGCDDDDKAEFMMKAFVVVFWMLFGKRLDSSPEARP